jgi:hypothetical protein
VISSTMLVATEPMRFIPVCALFVLISQTLYSEDASKSPVKDLAKHWQTLKSLSLAVARAIPEDAYSSKVPYSELDPNVRGPYEMGSLALANVLSCSMAFGTPAPGKFQSAFDRPMDSTKTGVINNLTVAYDYCIDGLKRIPDADLFAMAARFKGHPATKFDILWDASAHAAHALGQADLYLRLKGITPPDTGPRFEF